MVSLFAMRCSSRGSGSKRYEESKPRLTSAEKRAKRRLGYEPPGQVRRNSFVEKLDRKDPEDQGSHSLVPRLIMLFLVSFKGENSYQNVTRMSHVTIE